MGPAEGEEKLSEGIRRPPRGRFIKQSLPWRAEWEGARPQRRGLCTNSEAPRSTFIQRCQGELEWGAWRVGGIRRMTELRKWLEEMRLYSYGVARW